MTGHARHLPAVQIGKNIFGQGFVFFLQPGYLIADIQVIVTTHKAQLFNFGLQVGNGLFKI